jgi:hypothetical protein
MFIIRNRAISSLPWGQSRRLLDKGFFVAARKCFWGYDQSIFKTTSEHLAERGGSKVDYVALVDNKPMGLCETKSPSVMKNVCGSLPSHGTELKWFHGQPLVPKILSKLSMLFPLVMALVFKEM